jgi:nucleotidyltransferase/DNA polymerase involved in DNA repair
MTPTQARAVCPGLLVKIRDHQKETAEEERIQKALHRLGPCVQICSQRPNGTLIAYLETTGLKRLHRREDDLARKILLAITDLNYPAQVGIAGNRLVAKAAAGMSSPGSFTIVPDDKEKEFVENLPTECLDLKVETQESLRVLGLRRMEETAAFPANEIAARFGLEGRVISQASRGSDNSLFRREYFQEELSHEIFLTYPLTTTEAVRHHFRRLIHPLFDQLKQQGMGCDRIELILSPDDRKAEKIRLELAVKEPTLVISQFERQLINQLDQIKLHSRVVELTVTIPKTAILPCRQLDLGGLCPQPAAINRGNIYSQSDNLKLFAVAFNHAFLPEQSFSLIPMERSQKKQSARQVPGETSKPAFALCPVEGLRLLKIPTPIEVITDQGEMTAIRSRRTGYKTVACHSGPWGISGGWWQRGFDRLYYRMQTTDRRCYLFFFDRLKQEWYLQGVFD